MKRVLLSLKVAVLLLFAGCAKEYVEEKQIEEMDAKWESWRQDEYFDAVKKVIDKNVETAFKNL